MVEGVSKLAELILDCSVISHMFCDKTFFTIYSTVTAHETVSIGDACNIPMAGHGSVHFQSVLSNGFQTITLHGAHFQASWQSSQPCKLQQEGATILSYEGGL